MLLNLWPLDRLPPALRADDARSLKLQALVVAARRHALAGRYRKAAADLEALEAALSRALADGRTRSPASGLGDLLLAADFERVRSHPSGGLAEAAPLERLISRLERAPAETGASAATRAACLAIARSELSLAQVLRRDPADPFTRLGELLRRMEIDRLEGVSSLGRRHPAIGVLDLHLAFAGHFLRAYDAAFGWLADAESCFRGRDPVEAALFAHERSDVLLKWAELAIDTGQLAEAEALLDRVLELKKAERDGAARSGERGQVRARAARVGSSARGGGDRGEGREETRTLARPGILLLVPGDERATDVPGLAKHHGIRGKLLHHRGRLHEALEAYEEDARLSLKARDRGFVANKHGQLYLEAGAYGLAKQAFEQNIASGGSRLNLAFAHTGLARAELIPPTLVSPAAGDDARQIALRRRARELAGEALARAREQVEALGGTDEASERFRAHASIREWVEALDVLVRAFESLDRLAPTDAAVADFESLRARLLALAARFEARHEAAYAGDILRDALRLEVWAWRTRGYLPSEPGGTYERLLDLWERMGARERAVDLLRFGEESGYGDVYHVLLDRYFPEVARGGEVQPAREMTVLFGDIRDFSGLCRALGRPERIIEALAGLFRAINPIVLSHRGTILRYQGDSILVAFNVDGGDPDHAGHAVQCALDVQEAVRRLGRTRAAHDPGARPLALPVGIYTGEAAVAHLTIPGRREVTVYGNCVNLAARLQERLKGTAEWLFASGETLSRVKAPAFRAFPFALGAEVKGYGGGPCRVDIHALRPVLPFRTSFAGLGSVLRPQDGVLALDVGNTAAAGVIDHHHAGIEGSTTSLVFSHPEWVRGAPGGDASDLEVVTHVEPDFDACAATLVAIETLEGRLGGPREGEDPERRRALRALAEYATRVDKGLVDLDETRPESSPYALLACVATLRRRGQGPSRPPSVAPLDRRILERGVLLLHLAVTEAARSPRADFARIFREVPGGFEAEAEEARRDFQLYAAHDREALRDETFYVPRADGGAVSEQRCGVMTGPRSSLFKVWARRDGRSMLLVAYAPQLKPFETSKGEPVELPLQRFVISVLPDSGLSLARLAAELDRTETAFRERLSRELDVRLVRLGPPRPGFDNSDPWYDGRSALLAHTIVDTPRQGSVLELEDVLGVARSVMGRPPAE